MSAHLFRLASHNPRRARAYCAHHDLARRIAMVRDLIRPEEVSPLLTRQEAVLARTCGAATAVTTVMQGLRESGALRYERDPTRCDLWQSPRLTLERGCGDCEDSTFLAASLAAALRCEPQVVLYRCTPLSLALVSSGLCRTRQPT